MQFFKGTKGPWKSGESFYTNHASIDAPEHGAIAHVLVKMDGDYTTQDSKRVAKEAELAANLRAIECAAEMAEMLLELHFLGAQRAFEQLTKGIQPMVPISPAHELKYQPLKLQDIAVGRVFTGKSANTGQVYTASVKVIENASGAYGKTTAIISTMLSIEGNAVSPFERPMTEDSLFKEFVCWEK